MPQRDDFFSFIAPEHLYLLALVFAIATAGIVIAIYVTLYLNKRDHRLRMANISLLNDWITETIVDDEFTLTLDQVPGKIKSGLKDRFYRQLVIDQLIVTKRNMTGTAAAHIVSLYQLLALRNDSLRKLASRNDNVCAHGIYELYMMDQYDMLPRFFRLTNHRIEVIRDEAQVATAGFIGARGLGFLRYLDHPLNDWQQLKLLDRLQQHANMDLAALPRWLKSQNHDVVRFALKIAGVYQQFDQHDRVVECLDHTSVRIRKQAYETLTAIANNETPTILLHRFWQEPGELQLVIIKQLAAMQAELPAAFLEKVFANADEVLKLELSRAVAASNCTFDKALLPFGIPATIIQQIQYERTA